MSLDSRGLITARGDQEMAAKLKPRAETPGAWKALGTPAMAALVASEALSIEQIPSEYAQEVAMIAASLPVKASIEGVMALD